MSLSSRYSIHWPESQASESEPTTTLVVSSPKGLYVDIRPLKDGSGFDWFFAGYEIPITPAKFEFNHEFYDSEYINHYFNHNFSSKGFKFGSDVGNFQNSKDPIESAKGIRVETGEMINSKTGKVEPYIEKWITCDSNKIPDLTYVGDGKDNSFSRCLVLDTKFGSILDNENVDDAVVGRFIVLGKWVQALIWNKAIHSSIEDSVGVIRYVEGSESTPMISFGGQINSLPKLSQLLDNKDYKIGDTAITINNVSWIVKEVSNW